MGDVVYTLLLLFIPIIGQFANTITHVIWNCRNYGKNHLGSICTSFLCGLLLQNIILYYVFINNDIQSYERIGALFLCGATYFGLGYCYFTFVNLLRTSLRIHILSELHASDDCIISIRDLYNTYGSVDVANLRIKRLVQWKQLRLENNTIYSSGKAFVILGETVQFLRILMGVNNTESNAHELLDIARNVLKSKFVQWWNVGIIFLLIGLLISYILIDILSYSVIVGTLISTIFGAFFRFFVLDRFVFEKTSINIFQRFFKYQATYAVSYLSGWIFINLLVMIGLNYLVAIIIATMLTTLFTMFSHFKWVWRKNN